MKKIFLILSLVLFLGTNAQAGLVAYWNFNEGAGDTANDSSANGNQASGLNNEWVPGKYGFGTASDNIVVQPSISLIASSSITMMAWVKIDEFNGLQRRIAEMTPDYGFLFNPQNIDGETPFLFEHNLTNYGFEFQKPSLDEWFHAAISWDGNTAQFYYNGIAATPVTVATSIIHNTDVPLYMGAQGYTLDEVRIYNHALTQDEIIRDMNTNSVVPEPASMILFGTGLAGAFLRRKSNLTAF